MVSVCLSVRLYQINGKTAEPIGPKFCVFNRTKQIEMFVFENCVKNLLFHENKF